MAYFYACTFGTQTPAYIIIQQEHKRMVNNLTDYIGSSGKLIEFYKVSRILMPSRYQERCSKW